MRFGGISWMQAMFCGIGAAAIGIIAMSAKKLTQKSISKDKLLWAIYLTLVLVTAITESKIAWLFVAAGVLVWLLRAPPFRPDHLSDDAPLMAADAASGSRLLLSISPYLARQTFGPFRFSG